MGKIEKSKMCKIGKEDVLKKKLDDILPFVSDPGFICMKCGRVSNTKKMLCSPKKIT